MIAVPVMIAAIRSDCVWSVMIVEPGSRVASRISAVS